MINIVSIEDDHGNIIQYDRSNTIVFVMESGRNFETRQINGEADLDRDYGCKWDVILRQTGTDKIAKSFKTQKEANNFVKTIGCIVIDLTRNA